jgi:hypothetical protein
MLTRPLSLSFVFNIPYGSAITFLQNQKRMSVVAGALPDDTPKTDALDRMFRKSYHSHKSSSIR